MRKEEAGSEFPCRLPVRCFLFRAQLDVAIMNNIAIFGCGAAGKGAFRQLQTRYRIVSFLDNDPEKHGSRVLGVPVRNPETYNYAKVDHVFIASMYLDEILVQLLRLEVPS